MSEETHLEFYRRWKRLSSPYVAWQFKQFEPFLGKRCAGIGCGLGNFLPFFLDRGFYLGVDSDQELVEEFPKELPQNGFSVILGDATDPALVDILRSHEVDTILCVNVLEHVQQDRVALENLVEALPAVGSVSLCPHFRASLELLTASMGTFGVIQNGH